MSASAGIPFMLVDWVLAGFANVQCASNCFIILLCVYIFSFIVNVISLCFIVVSADWLLASFANVHCASNCFMLLLYVYIFSFI